MKKVQITESAILRDIENGKEENKKAKSKASTDVQEKDTKEIPKP